MTTDTPTLDQALAIAQRLSRSDRAALITTLVQTLAVEAPAPADGLARFQSFAADFRAAHPHADVSGRLEADRREREASMRGGDVHP